MISKKAEDILNKAGLYAYENDHEYCTLEHVFLMLLSDASVLDVLHACGVNVEKMKEDLIQYLDQEVPKVDANSGDAADVDRPIATLSVQNLLQRALFHVQSAGKDEVKPIDLFVAIFQARDSQSLFLLTKQGLERLNVINYLSHGHVAGDQLPAVQDSESSEDGDGFQSAEQDPLKAFAINLNEQAKQGKIDPLIGRGQELERMIQTLCRRRKNNPLLVGEAGVGKTALAEGLALRIVSGDVPDLLSGCEIFSLDMGSVVAGTKFRGDFEQRLKKILSALVQRKEKGAQPILFIDEIHMVIGAGSVSGGSMDAANILKPFLSKGEIRCIGSTTYTEYRNIFEKDNALSRRFQKIDVNEPTSEETIQILRGLKTKFEEHHKVTYSDDAIRASVDLSVKHLADRFLPDKAIDLLDETGARARIAKKTTVDAAAIEEVVAQVARIPARSVSSNQKQKLKNLDRDLKLTIFGQEKAVESIVAAIHLSRSGLRSGEKPVGSFLFCGPTGVGKTELTKQLSNSLGISLHRFDMSEYMEKHTVSRLIGAPPGYVGHEQAGLLTEAVRKNPHSVILLDEIEKAHPDVWNLLLQVMDHGTLTDNFGRKSDFRNTILIMTSNVGAREMERRPLGMVGQAGMGTPQKEVERTFSPEFRNRIDAIVYFNPLNAATIAQVLDKHLAELDSQLMAKSVEIEVTDEVKHYLTEKGYDRLMGARPMARLIQDRLRKPLAEEILFGKLEHGGKVKVIIDGEELKFEIESRKARDEDPEKGKASSETVDA